MRLQELLVRIAKTKFVGVEPSVAELLPSAPALLPHASAPSSALPQSSGGDASATGAPKYVSPAKVTAMKQRLCRVLARMKGGGRFG